VGKKPKKMGSHFHLAHCGRKRRAACGSERLKTRREAPNNAMKSYGKLHGNNGPKGAQARRIYAKKAEVFTSAFTVE